MNLQLGSLRRRAGLDNPASTRPSATDPRVALTMIAPYRAHDHCHRVPRHCNGRFRAAGTGGGGDTTVEMPSASAYKPPRTNDTAPNSTIGSEPFQTEEDESGGGGGEHDRLWAPGGPRLRGCARRRAAAAKRSPIAENTALGDIPGGEKSTVREAKRIGIVRLDGAGIIRLSLGRGALRGFLLPPSPRQV